MVSYEEKKLERRKKLMEEVGSVYYKLMNEFYEDLSNIRYSIKDIPGGKAKITDYPAKNTLQIWLPDVPPFFSKLRKRRSEDQLAIKEYWIGIVQRALDEASIIDMGYENALTILEYNLPYTSRSWDVDNIASKFIVDAMRYRRIYKHGDSQDSLSIMAVGKRCKNDPFTRVFTFEIGQNDIVDLISRKLCKNRE